MTPQQNDWLLVAQQVRNANDPKKMMQLLVELNRLLECEEKARKQSEFKHYVASITASGDIAA